MPDLPSGTVTFLFTDIAGSTQRWERDAEAMRALLVRHDALLGAAIEDYGGVVFKTVGDAFYAAFRNAPAALAAALAAQRALFAADWGDDPLRVRMALHTGTVEARDGDYFGRPLNRVARLLSAGHGGQTLVSSVTEELIRDSLPDGIGLRDMGEARLKDLLRPEHIFQVIAPDLPTDFPPLKTLDTQRTNLPAQANMLVGREREAMEVVALLRRDDVRLVTLTGPGGTGKTRLALQAAAECLDHFADGVFFVPLDDVVDPARVLPHIAETLGIAEGGGQPLIARLHATLREQQTLLVLDNFEQVVAAGAAISRLLAAAPGLRALVTSRSALRIYGEREYAVPPLPLPNWRRTLSVESAMQYEAVRLFVARAQEVKADFALTASNTKAVVEICARLDGLPLAIELAAARIKLLTPQALLQRLTHALQVLTGGARDLPARQQTLRGAIDWSYTTLGAEEQTLFARMAVFAGGGTLAAIEAICSVARDLKTEIVDSLSSLADKSLLRHVEGRGGEPRFAMLGTIREYALERLEARGELATMRHARTMYYLALAEEAEQHLAGTEQGPWLTRLEEEHDNVRASIRNALEASEYEAAVRLVAAFWRFWSVRGYLTEGRHWIEQALAHAEDVPPLMRAKALDGLGALMRAQGEYEAAQQRFEESLAIRRDLGHQAGIAHSLTNLAGMARDQGDFETARDLYDECLAIRRAMGDTEAVTRTLINLGILAQRQGDYATARAQYEESLAIGRAEGHQQAIAHALMNLGVAAQHQGDDAIARIHYEESLAAARAAGDSATVGFALNNLGAVAKQQGDFAAARAFYQQSLALRRELGDMRAIAFSLTNLGMIAQQQGDYAAARSHYDEALAIRRELGDPRALPFSLNNLALVARQQGDNATARAAALESLALSQQLDDVRGIIAALESLAALAGVQGDMARAARLWGAIETFRTEGRFPRVPEEQTQYERDRDAARHGAAGNVWEIAWAEGSALPLLRAIELATAPADVPTMPSSPSRPAPPGVPDATSPP